jgi:hypothetical protein
LVGDVDFTTWETSVNISATTTDSFTNSGTAYIWKNLGLTTGKYYAVTVNLNTVAGSSTVAYSGTDTTYTGVGTISDSTETSFVFKASGPDFGFRVSLTTGTTVSLANISVKELPGNHATQITADKRPTLARVPVGGRRNLLEYTEQFDDAKWFKGASPDYSVTPNDTTDPNGNVTADKLTALTGQSSLSQAVTLTATAHSFSFYVKYSNHDWVRIGYIGSASNAAWFNVETGEKGTVVGAGNTSEMEPLDNGWYRVTLNIATGSTNSENVFISLSGADGEVVGTLPGDSIYIYGAQLELGSTATDYQKVVSEYDVTEAGVDSVDYLSFNGTNNGMATASIDFTSTDEMSVFAGARKLSDATVAVLAETSANFGLNNGSFILLHPADNATGNYGWGVKGTSATVASVRAATYSAPISNVVTGLADIGSPFRTIRVDGSATTSTTTLGATNFGNYPLNIGARDAAGTDSLWFEGNLYGLIVRGAASTSDEITNTETYFGTRSGFYAPVITGLPTIGVS